VHVSSAFQNSEAVVEILKKYRQKIIWFESLVLIEITYRRILGVYGNLGGVRHMVSFRCLSAFVVRIPCLGVWVLIPVGVHVKKHKFGQISRYM
jgi:hypothetical protein